MRAYSIHTLRTRRMDDAGTRINERACGVLTHDPIAKVEPLFSYKTPG